MQFLQSIAEATGISIEILIEQWEALASKIEETAARTGKSIKVFGDAAREASAVVGGDEEGTTPTYRAPGGSGGGTGGGGGGSAFGSLYGPNSPGAYGAAYRAGVRSWGAFEKWVNSQVELGNAILDEAKPQSVKLTPKGYEAHTNAINVGGKVYNPSTPEQALAYLKARDQEAAKAAGRPSLEDLGRNPMGVGMTAKELAAFRQEFDDTNAAMQGLNTSVGTLSDEMQKTADEMADGTRKATDALGRFAGLLEPSEFDSLRQIPIFDAFFGGADFSHFFNKDVGHGTATGSSTMNNETRVYIDSEEVSARVEKRLLPAKGTVRT
jgi:hypothetical protein